MNSYTIVFTPTKAHGDADAVSQLPFPVQPAMVPHSPKMILLIEQLDRSTVSTTTV